MTNDKTIVMATNQPGVHIPDLLSAFLGGIKFLPLPSQSDNNNNSHKHTTQGQGLITCKSNTINAKEGTCTASCEADVEPNGIDENSCDYEGEDEVIKRMANTYGSLDEVERDLDATLKDLASEMDAVRMRSSKMSSISEEEDKLRIKLKELTLKRLALESESERCSHSIDDKTQKVDLLRSVMQQIRCSQDSTGESKIINTKEYDKWTESVTDSETPTVAMTVSWSRSTFDDDLNSLIPIEDDCSASLSLPDANLDIYELSTLSSESNSLDGDDDCSINGKIVNATSDECEALSPSFYMKIGDLDCVICSNPLNVKIHKSMDPKELADIVSSLVERGKLFSMIDDSNIWIPTKETYHFYRKNSARKLNTKDILVWNGKPFDYSQNNLDSKVYGIDIPVIRALGLIKTDTKTLLNLLWDSDRIREFNEMSLGRFDEIYFQDWTNSEKYSDSNQTKVVKSLSKVPLVGKPLELFNFMHTEKWEEYESVENICCYIIATRGLDKTQADTSKASQGILFSFYVLRPVQCNVEGKFCHWTELTTISHFNISGIPQFIALSVGQKSAANFISKIQNVYEY